MAYSAPLWSPSYLKFFFFSYLKFLQRFSVHTFPKHFLISHSSKHSSQFAFSVIAIVKINTSIAYFSAFNLKVSFFKFYFCSLSWLIFKFPVFFFFSCAILILLFLSLYFWLLCLYLTWEPGSLPSFIYLLRSSFQPHGCHYHIYTNKTKFKFSVSPSCPGTSIWMFCHCCSLSPVWLCDHMDCSTPGSPVLHYLLGFVQTHVHWVSDSIQPSHPLSAPSPPAFNLSQHQDLFQWVSSPHQVAKVLELQLQHQSFQWIFRADFF